MNNFAEELSKKDKREKEEKEEKEKDAEWTEYVFPFVKLDRVKRKKLLNLLKDKNLGDDVIRNLFINDVEAWIGILDEGEKDGNSHEDIREELKTIKNKSDELIKLLRDRKHKTNKWIINGMSGMSSGRIINRDAVTEIENKVTQLRDSCAWSIDAAKPKRRPGSVSGGQKEFVRQIAQSYLRHFSKNPSSSRNGVFMQVLEKSGILFNIEIPSEKILKQVLSEMSD